MRPRASAATVCMLRVGLCRALKLLPRATAAPASIKARAGAILGSSNEASGTSVTVSPASPMRRASEGEMCSR